MLQALHFNAVVCSWVSKSKPLAKLDLWITLEAETRVPSQLPCTSCSLTAPLWATWSESHTIHFSLVRAVSNMLLPLSKGLVCGSTICFGTRLGRCVQLSPPHSSDFQYHLLRRRMQMLNCLFLLGTIQPVFLQPGEEEMQHHLATGCSPNSKNVSWLFVQFLILITQNCCEQFELQVVSWGLQCCLARVNVVFLCGFFHTFQLCLPLLVLGNSPPMPRTHPGPAAVNTDTGMCSSPWVMLLPLL